MAILRYGWAAGHHDKDSYTAQDTAIVTKVLCPEKLVFLLQLLGK
jgi:hypothetical protein